jgi:hypothetical protein
MTSNRISSRTKDCSNVSTVDRLALSRAQHLQSRENRPKSISDDEIDAASDWSDSDRECCPLSDFGSNADLYDNDDHRQETKLLPEIFHPNASRLIETPLPMIDDSNTSTRISFSSENEKPKIPSVIRKQIQAPLLPARRIQTKQVSPTRPVTNPELPYNLRYGKTITSSPTRIYLRRENTSTSTSSNTHLSKDSTNSSFHSHDEHQNLRTIVSPNLSQSSVPRVYELKKIFVDDYDYGRLTDFSSTRPVRPPSRQKWGTIVHPPFPLGYQHIAPEQVTQAVERLSSPVRCRERHTPIQTPSKRYLSVEETEALVKNFSSFLKYLHDSFAFFLDKSTNESQNHSIA